MLTPRSVLASQYSEINPNLTAEIIVMLPFSLHTRHIKTMHDCILYALGADIFIYVQSGILIYTYMKCIFVLCLVFCTNELKDPLVHKKTI